ncbi:glycosyl transferase, partial [Lentinus tigrinus ALCF2SS1-6]
MITGYKKKRLGHPSKRLFGDVPREKWRAVIFSEIIFPIIMAVLFVIVYMFVKAFPDKDGKQLPSLLACIAIISLGPVVWNAAVILVLFMSSLSLGLML